ncbi:MAG: hypothetical protein KC731_31965 [Myxococcales bacterium]|nr:hypothetical protein [Myxococcales bacterium]
MSEDDRTADAELEAHVAAAHDEAGVDLSQVDAMLALTPAERLAVLYETATSLGRLMPHDDSDPVV